MNYKKYTRQYFMPENPTYDWVKKNILTRHLYGAAWI